MTVILSLDISTTSTGWCITSDGKHYKEGVIRIKSPKNFSEKLSIFADELRNILRFFKPTNIVQESAFGGPNIKTLKALSEFSGVSKLVCWEVVGVEPCMVANTTVKSYFKVKTKKELFSFACSIFENDMLTFKDDNDIIDARMQLMYYADVVLDLYKYRIEKEYGYIYRGIINE